MGCPPSRIFIQKHKTLFGRSQIRINPRVLGWIGVELKLNSTPIHPTHVDRGESDNIPTRPKRGLTIVRLHKTHICLFKLPEVQIERLKKDEFTPQP
jgi:hypothetical protein